MDNKLPKRNFHIMKSTGIGAPFLYVGSRATEEEAESAIEFFIEWHSILYSGQKVKAEFKIIESPEAPTIARQTHRSSKMDEVIELDFKQYWGIENTQLSIRGILGAQRFGCKISKLPECVREKIREARQEEAKQFNSLFICHTEPSD